MSRLRSLLLWVAPLGIPHLEALDVELKVLPSLRRRLDQQLFLRKSCFTRIALLARAWTALDLRGAVMRQATVLELLADDDTDSFRVH